MSLCVSTPTAHGQLSKPAEELRDAGFRIGNVMVSPIHANFFINDAQSQEKAITADYFALIQHVHETVYSHSGVDLETEIELMGDWD